MGEDWIAWIFRIVDAILAGRHPNSPVTGLPFNGGVSVGCDEIKIVGAILFYDTAWGRIRPEEIPFAFGSSLQDVPVIYPIAGLRDEAVYQVCRVNGVAAGKIGYPRKPIQKSLDRGEIDGCDQNQKREEQDKRFER